MNRDKFDPDDLSPEALAYLAKHLKKFLDVTEKMMFIPDEIKDSADMNQYKEGRRRAEILVKKLNKGKTSMFNDKIQTL